MSDINNGLNTETQTQQAAEDVKSLVDRCVNLSGTLKSDNEKHATTTREQTNRLVVEILKMAVRCESSADMREAALRLAVERGITRPGEGTNHGLLYARLGHGHFKEGKWKVNRSGEKWAAIVRLVLENGIDPEELLKPLNEQTKRMIAGKEIKVTLANLMEMDHERHGKPRAREIFTNDEVRKAAGLRPIATVALNSSLAEALTFSEGYALVVVRRFDDTLEILGDSGKQANDVFRPVMNLSVPKG